MKTDIVIIGGGIIGCSTAYFLAKKGLKVLLLEKNTAIGLEASGRCACGVRQQGRTAALPLAMASVRLWLTLADELACDLEYDRIGNLRVALNPERHEFLEKELEWEHAQGLTEVRILTPAECRKLIPGLNDQTISGKICPTDGIANPMRVTPAFARAATRLGAEIRTNTLVTGFLRQGQAVCGVTTDSREIKAKIVINTAGPWAMKLNDMVGCYTPIQPGLSQLIITERQPKRITPFTSFAKIGYILQTKSGNIIIGIEGKPNDKFSKAVDYADIALKSRQIVDILPWMGDISFIRTFAGITEYTPDDEPYIGEILGIPGFFTASGFNGQGFCVGPIVGKVMAELIDGEEPSVSLDPFKPDRLLKSEYASDASTNI